MENAEPEPIPLPKPNPGTTSVKSDRSYICSSASISAVKASTEIAISCVDSSFLVAVTTTSSTSWAKIEIENATVRKVENKYFLKFNINVPPYMFVSYNSVILIKKGWINQPFYNF